MWPPPPQRPLLAPGDQGWGICEEEELLFIVSYMCEPICAVCGSAPGFCPWPRMFRTDIRQGHMPGYLPGMPLLLPSECPFRCRPQVVPDLDTAIPQPTASGAASAHEVVIIILQHYEGHCPFRSQKLGAGVTPRSQDCLADLTAVVAS